jgi:hypothetical protein
VCDNTLNSSHIHASYSTCALCSSLMLDSHIADIFLHLASGERFLTLRCAVYFRAECALMPFIQCFVCAGLYNDERYVATFPPVTNVPLCNFL